jgi:hypothetical protein
MQQHPPKSWSPTATSQPRRPRLVSVLMFNLRNYMRDTDGSWYWEASSKSCQVNLILDRIGPNLTLHEAQIKPYYFSQTRLIVQKRFT